MAKGILVQEVGGTIQHLLAPSQAGDTLVTLADTQTLTNKTLTNPTINSASGTLVAPTAASPAQTTEGSIVWDSDDDLLTVGDGSARKTMCDTAGTQTLTNKTLTSPVLGGSVTGTYTLAGTPTITSPTVTGATMTTTTLSTGTLGGDLVNSAVKRCSADTTATTSTTLADITGLTGFALTAAGTYLFEVDLQVNSSVNGGLGVAFKFTTATLTSIQCLATGQDPADNNICARGTTATDAALQFNSKAAVWVNVRLTGTMVVNAGGTVAVQMAQETSHGDTTTVYAGSWARFTRIA